VCDLETLAFAFIAAGLVLYSAATKWLEASPITGPMVFTAFGLALGPWFGVVDIDFSQGFIHGLAEVTLVVVLFSDAARIDLRAVRRDHNVPVRMLVIGMPLIILFGTAAALLLPLGLTLWEAALLAAILAPTDAALGQSVVASHLVPARIRQALNIESGLNDGIALPLVLLFFSLSVFSYGGEESNWLLFGARQIILGPIAGIAIGWVFSRLIDAATRSGWMAESYHGPAILGVALLTFAGAELIGGNGFIAAFVGGVIFGNQVREHCKFLFRFIEAECHLLVLLTFLVFGAAVLPRSFGLISWEVVIYALASLTIVRMVPIAGALMGAGLRRPTVVFLGWFGPRGLASILFALFILEKAHFPGAETILVVLIVTCGLSIVVHGMTAAPATARLGAYLSKKRKMEEMKAVEEMPTRAGDMFGK